MKTLVEDPDPRSTWIIRALTIVLLLGLALLWNVRSISYVLLGD
jgi:hypothetical protein